MKLVNEFNIEEMKTEFAELCKTLAITGKNKRKYKQRLAQICKEIADSSSVEEIHNALMDFFIEFCDTGKVKYKFFSFSNDIKRDIFGFSCLKTHLESYLILKEGRILEQNINDMNQHPSYLSLTLEMPNGDIEKAEYKITKYNTHINETVIRYINNDVCVIYPHNELS